jgi:polyribonucleotide nucleotidyltransferase
MYSDIPWNGPIGCVRNGEIHDHFAASPTKERMFPSTLGLISVGNAQNIMMIEGNGRPITEERFIEAPEFDNNKCNKSFRSRQNWPKWLENGKRNLNDSCQRKTL